MKRTTCDNHSDTLAVTTVAAGRLTAGMRPILGGFGIGNPHYVDLCHACALVAWPLLHLPGDPPEAPRG